MVLRKRSVQRSLTYILGSEFNLYLGKLQRSSPKLKIWSKSNPTSHPSVEGNLTVWLTDLRVKLPVSTFRVSRAHKTTLMGMSPKLHWGEITSSVHALPRRQLANGCLSLLIVSLTACSDAGYLPKLTRRPLILPLFKQHIILHFHHETQPKSSYRGISIDTHKLKFPLLGRVGRNCCPPVIILHQVLLRGVKDFLRSHADGKRLLLNRSINEKLRAGIRKAEGLPHAGWGIWYSIQVVWEKDKGEPLISSRVYLRPDCYPRG
jgi:hypothetical protein